MSTVLANPSVSINVSSNFTNSVAFPGSGTQLRQTPFIALTAGVAAGNVNCGIAKSFSVVSGTPLVINVASGLDPQGNAAAMARVISVTVENDSTTTGQTLTVGGGTDPVMGTSQMDVQANPNGAGGGFTVANTDGGWVYNVSTANSITIVAATGTIAGKITILGCTV